MKTIVENINNGIIINKLYNQWDSIRTAEEYKEWVKQVAATKFGTYENITILDVLCKFSCKFSNDIEKRDFLREVSDAYNGEVCTIFFK